MKATSPGERRRPSIRTRIPAGRRGCTESPRWCPRCCGCPARARLDRPVGGDGLAAKGRQIGAQARGPARDGPLHSRLGRLGGRHGAYERHPSAHEYPRVPSPSPILGGPSALWTVSCLLAAPPRGGRGSTKRARVPAAHARARMHAPRQDAVGCARRPGRDGSTTIIPPSRPPRCARWSRGWLMWF